MPGYLGGSTSSGGVGGEIKFPTEFIDPVTKLRISNPENLIDTDFEYGLQPTKWETVELINNTPSFFSKSGDTTIDGISSITTQAGTREITVTTRLEHGLAVGIPISVSGTKSITADGAYIINSIPNPTTFTYLCKDDQPITASIEDLYSSIITGEFFQGSQLRIQSIVTDNASPLSTLTVTTDSTHGFQPNTPFYFLNLNSTISQEFQSANTEAKSFDSSNSATAQTFDGSNTASSINIDFSNSATIGGAQYTIGPTDPGLDTITVNDTGAGELQAAPVGQPLYYDVVSGSGFFAANPRGVVFLKSAQESASQIVITVSEVPNGDAINITGAMTGFFQLANQARTFAGNNIDLETETLVNLEKGSELVFDGANENGVSVGSPQFDGTSTFVVTSTSGTADIGPNGAGWTTNTMVLYQTDGTAATGLTNGETYFINQCFQVGSTNSYVMRVSELPGGSPINVSNDGTGTQTFTNIGISTTKDIFYVPNHNLQQYDMVKYTYPEAGRFNADEVQDFYWVQNVYDNNTFTLTHTLGELLPAYQKVGPVDYGTPITPTSITVVGFVTPYSFTITQGTLPQGLTLNESTGVISGTPTEVYNSSVIVTISDADGSQGFMEVAFEFTQPPFLYDFTNVTFSSPLSGPSGPSLSQARSSMSGTPTPSNWNTDTANFNMNITGLQRWTVPQDATYRIEAAGAQGGDGGRSGEPGARMRGDFALTQGDILVIVVGQRGNNGNNGGGGGGTFVWRDALGTNQLPLLAAGGGGGGELNGCSASGGTTSTSGIGDCAGSTSGGSNGGDGGGYYSADQGGRGWNNNDSNNFVGRTQRTTNGGFGGGGGGEGGDNGGGGGGGYSGGGGGRDYGPASGGGGGGSYNGGTNQSNSSAARNGTGYVSITKL